MEPIRLFRVQLFLCSLHSHVHHLFMSYAPKPDVGRFLVYVDVLSLLAMHLNTIEQASTTGILTMTN